MLHERVSTLSLYIHCLSCYGLPASSISKRKERFGTGSVSIFGWRGGESPNVLFPIRGGPGKSLARPGRKQATATKLGIYSTYSPRSSIHFLAPSSNFCKSLKKNQNVVRSTRSPRQQWPPRRTKNGDLPIVVCFLLGDSLASEIYMPTFRNTLSVPSS